MSRQKVNNTIAIQNFIWRFAERCGAQGVSFIVAIVLARLLNPTVYGTVALITVFITIFQVFIDSGLGTALIQKKDVDDLDFSSVFYFNICICLLLYIIMWVTSPWIAEFYDDITLVHIIRVLSLTLVISGVKNIQQAYVSRNMLFKRFFFSTIGGTLVSAVVGISMAFMGMGVWALVAQQLTNSLTDTIILWVTVKWRPKAIFSWRRLKVLLSFGWKLLLSALIDTVYNNIRNLIIGKMYTPADLAFYNQGDKFPSIIVTNINVSIDSVLLPTMSSVQDDTIKIKSMIRRSIKTSTYIMAPLMMGLAFCAPQIVELVLTDKWLPCVPFLRIFCITYMFWPVHTANLNAINAMGRSDIFLKLEIYKKVIGIALLLITMKISVFAMAFSLLISTIASMLINSWPNQKFLKYSFIEQLRDILPGIVIAIFMGVVISYFKYLPFATWIVLCLQIIAGMLLYIGLSLFFKLESFEYILRIIMINRKNKRKL